MHILYLIIISKGISLVSLVFNTYTVAMHFSKGGGGGGGGGGGEDDYNLLKKSTLESSGNGR